MSLRWEISNKVRILKGWARRRFGRVSGNRRQRIAGKSDRVAASLKQADGPGTPSNADPRFDEPPGGFTSQLESARTPADSHDAPRLRHPAPRR